MSNYDTIEMVEKGIDEIEVVEKFNPFHDKLGRFSSSRGFATYSANPNTKAGAMALARSHAAGHGKTINSHTSLANGKQKITDSYYAAAMGNEKGAAFGAYNKYIADQKAKHGQQEPKQKQPAKPSPKKQKVVDTETEDKKLGAKQKSHRPEKKLEGKAAEDAVMKDTGVDRKTAAKMVEAVKDFSGMDYGDIRSYQAKGYPPSMKGKAETIEDFITKSPKWDGGTLYRGINLDEASAKTLIAGMKNGKPINQNGLSSWSSDKSVADNFAHADVTFLSGASIIFKCSNTKSGTSIRHLSKYPHENEVLVSSKARWKATNITQKKTGDRTVYTVECEEIG